MDYSIEDFLEMFNNNDLAVEKYFNDYDTWFSILDKYGLMSEVDPHNAVGSEIWQNEYLLWLFKNNKPKFREWVEKFLADIAFDENGNAFLEVGNRGVLARLFCDNRNDISRDTIERILSDDGDVYEPYWDTTDNVYRDVIKELNQGNIEILKKRMIEEMKGRQLSPETEEMELISAEQGHDEYWELTEDNVARILDDEESMNSLLNDELSELKSNLYNIHSNSYNDAHESEVYNSIFSELNYYFEGSGEFLTKPHPYKKDTTYYYFRIPFHNLEQLVVNYLENNKEYGNSGTLEYQSTMLNIMEEYHDCLRTSVPDYPDFREVDKNINLYFSDFF